MIMSTIHRPNSGVHRPTPISSHLPPERVPVRGVPVSLTTFVGRDREKTEIGRLLSRDDVRLLTMIGPGGVGKTRVAMEVAANSEERLPDGVVFVSLAPIRDPSLVADAILDELGIPDDRELPPEERLIATLQDRHMLLVLDNFEHVNAAASLIARLLSACPRIRILATSRSRLRLSGEHVYAVPPLTVPPDGPHQCVTAIASHEAVRLFVQRAREYAPDFTLTSANAGAIGDICRRLDGLPLAIELAAARIDTLPPVSLLAQLVHRMPVLTGGPIDAPYRQRTMRDTIAWSYDLLGVSHQSAFRRLAVCVGGFTLDTADAITGEGNALIDTLTALVANNLLLMNEDASGEPRYTMLETIREYGIERLAASGEGDEIQDRHAALFVSLARRSDWSWWMPVAEGAAIQARLAADTANIRAALEWLDHIGNRESLLTLAGSLGSLWAICGDPREGERWLERALARSDGAPPRAIAKAKGTLSWVLNKQGKISRARVLAEESVCLFREVKDREGKFYSLILAGVAALGQCDFDQAHVSMEAALVELDMLVGSNWQTNAASHLQTLLGSIAFRRGDIAVAESCYAGAIARERATGHQAGTSHIFASHALAGLGDVARAQGDEKEALRHYRAALELAWLHRDMRAVARALGSVAGALAANGDVVVAARLFGASEALHERMGYPFGAETLDWQRALGLPEPWRRTAEGFGVAQAVHDALSRSQLQPLPRLRDPVQATRQWEAGRSLPVEEAITEALRSNPGPERSHNLSSREVEVLRLLTIGKTDVEIAQTLYIARRTAATHVEHIYTKINVSSRAEAAAWAVRQNLA